MLENAFSANLRTLISKIFRGSMLTDPIEGIKKMFCGSKHFLGPEPLGFEFNQVDRSASLLEKV